MPIKRGTAGGCAGPGAICVRGGKKAATGAGFTLIELIVVLAVMSILFAVVVPPMINYRGEVSERERLANESAINDAIRQCYALEGRYPPAVGETGLDYLRSNYQIIVKPNMYDYSYKIVDGSPVLRVEAREAKKR